MTLGEVNQIKQDVLDALSADWRLLRRHHPVGAYLPVGQLDGDCSCGAGDWPCAIIRARVFLGPPDNDPHL